MRNTKDGFSGFSKTYDEGEKVPEAKKKNEGLKDLLTKDAKIVQEFIKKNNSLLYNDDLARYAEGAEKDYGGLPREHGAIPQPSSKR